MARTKKGDYFVHKKSGRQFEVTGFPRRDPGGTNLHWPIRGGNDRVALRTLESGKVKHVQRSTLASAYEPLADQPDDPEPGEEFEPVDPEPDRFGTIMTTAESLGYIFTSQAEYDEAAATYDESRAGVADFKTPAITSDEVTDEPLVREGERVKIQGPPPRYRAVAGALFAPDRITDEAALVPRTWEDESSSPRDERAMDEEFSQTTKLLFALAVLLTALSVVLVVWSFTT